MPPKLFLNAERVGGPVNAKTPAIDDSGNDFSHQSHSGPDVERAAHIFWSAMHGPIMLELAGLLSPPLDARAIARPMLAMLLEKLGLSEV